MAVVNTVGTLDGAGLLADYRDVWMRTRRDMDPDVGKLMDLKGVTTTRTNTRGFIEAAPHMRYQAYDEPVVEQAMDSKNFSITNYIYSLEIPYSRWDAEDDQTDSTEQAVRQAGRDGGLNPERGLFDLLLNTTSFVPVVPNAADGLAGFYTSTRWGAAAGNSDVVSSWNASGPAARGGIYTALKLIGSYQDQHGQPLHPRDVLDSEVMVIGANDDQDVIYEALNMGLVAYANSTSNAGVDNVLPKKFKFAEPWITQRLDAGTMFIALTGTAVKPFIMQERSAIREWYCDETNDPEAKRTGRFAVGWNQRLGFGIGVPYAIVKILAA